MQPKNQIKKPFKKFITHPTNAKILFMMGVPGAGKSTFISTYVPPGFIKIDSDFIMRLYHKYILKTNPLNNHHPFAMREQAKKLSHKKLNYHLKQGHPIVFDGTALNIPKTQNRLKAAHKYGYHCALVLIKVNLQTALHRNANRRRQVPPAAIKEDFAQVQTSFNALANLFDYSFIFNNESTLNPKTKSQLPFIYSFKTEALAH